MELSILNNPSAIESSLDNSNPSFLASNAALPNSPFCAVKVIKVALLIFNEASNNCLEFTVKPFWAFNAST